MSATTFDQKSGLHLPQSAQSFELRPDGLRRWDPTPVPDVVKAMGHPVACFTRKRLRVQVSWDPYLKGNARGYHLCATHPARFPTWEEVYRARWDLIPEGVQMIMVAPDPRQWAALHQNTIHLFEIVDDLSTIVEAVFKKQPIKKAS